MLAGKPTYHAFVDESGDPHFSEGASDLFFVCATVMNENLITDYESKVQELKSLYNLAELKSNKLHNDGIRRNVLAEVNTWNLNVITIVVRKKDFDADGNWFRYKGSFYKYIERLLITEVVRIFGNVNITFDSFGRDNYRESFLSYIRKSVEKNSQISLFDPDIAMSTPQKDALIQLSDIIAGSLQMELNGKLDFPRECLNKVIKSQLNVGTPEWMKKALPSSDNQFEIDQDVVDMAMQSVDLFLSENRRKSDKKDACYTLDYLRSTFLYENPHKFCYRVEIKNWLNYRGLQDYTEDKISRQIVSTLRESGVMIVSTQEGIKIPSCKKDLKEYFGFILGQAIPSLKRLKKINQTVSCRFPEKFADLLDSESKQVLNALTDYKR